MDEPQVGEIWMAVCGSNYYIIRYDGHSDLSKTWPYRGTVLAASEETGVPEAIFDREELVCKVATPPNADLEEDDE